MRRRVAGLFATVFGLLLLVLPAPASQAETTNRVADSGWWWRVQAGVGVPLPPPPNVEPGQLMVQSTVEGEQAIAALDIVVAEGQTNPVLTLTVDGDGGGGAAAVLLACQAGSAWVGEDAGRWDAKPKADCTTSVTGIAADDGSSWTFPLGTLQFGDRANVVIVPGKLADSDANPTFNIVFDEPTAESIQTTAGQAPPPTTRPPSTQPAPAPTFDSGGGFAPSPTAPAPAFSPPATALPAQPVLDDEGQGLADDAPIVQAGEELAASVAAPEPRTLARIVGLLVLLGGAALLVASNRSPLVAAAASADAPVEGGLARFRTTRTSEPDPVS